MQLQNGFEIFTSKSFFDLWRTELIASMTLVDVLTEGELYYYESDYCCDVWVVVGERSLLVGYAHGESHELIRQRVRAWRNVLDARVRGTPRPQSGGDFAFAAEVDASGEHVIVAQCAPGDWAGLALGRCHSLAKKRYQLPSGWPESYRARIAELACRRVG